MPSEMQLKPEEVLEELRRRDREENPVMIAGDLTDELKASRPIINDRLEMLEEDGKVKSVKAGRSTAYWPADEAVGWRDDVEPVEVPPKVVEPDEELAAEVLAVALKAVSFALGVGGIALTAWLAATGASLPVLMGVGGATIFFLGGAVVGTDQLAHGISASIRAYLQGGPVGLYKYGRQIYVDEHPAPKDPQTRVERWAWLDVTGEKLLVAAAASAVVVGVVQVSVGVVATFGPVGGLVAVAVPLALAYGYVGCMLVASAAQLSLAEDGEAAVAVEEGAEA